MTITTYTGVKIDPLVPRIEQINIEDISHALSMICRFAGHTHEFYSVAQHSWIVSQNVPEKDRLWGLLHDATEAYLSDIPSPVKKSLRDYKRAEEHLMAVIAARFGLGTEVPESVKKADKRVLATEARDLTSHSTMLNQTPLNDIIKPWSPRTAKSAFLAAFYDYRQTAA